jgi:guanylate kinase
MTGASGVGKGTLRSRVLQVRPMYYSISMTTRPPRPGERPGVDYHFVSREAFEEAIARGDLLEWARYIDDYYGTPRKPIEEALERGEDALLEIEVQGALQVAEQVPEAILIFIIPPSLSELRRRLISRGTEGPDKIRRRLLRAEEELKVAPRFHYILVNDQLDSAVADFLAILRAEDLKSSRMTEALRRAASRDPQLEALLDAQEQGLVE